MSQQNNQDNHAQNRKKEIVTIIQNMLPQWGQLPSSEIVVIRMTGITNETYKISHPKKQFAFIFREFGDASDNIFINRDAQAFIYKYVGENNMGPKILASSDDIRLETFIESKTMKTEDMLKIQYIENIAHTLRRFHSLKPSQKISKKSLFTLAYFENGSPIYEKTRKKMEKDIFTQKQQQQLKQLDSWVTKQEIDFLKQITYTFENQSSLVFSHNDLLAGNILLRSKDNKVIFIDYEYSCFNYNFYDIANYLQQSCIDYTLKEQPFFAFNEFPQGWQSKLDRFIECYIQAQGKTYPVYREILSRNEKLSEKQLKQFQQIKNNILIGLILSNIMWGWWAIIVSKNQNINFDYISFAVQRYRLYKKYKNQFLEKRKQKKQ